jgi:hypothetical protein
MKECPHLNSCPKIAIILDKDAFDSQLREAVVAVCNKCEERAKWTVSTTGA